MALANALTMTPVWLDPADVKAWLRVNNQDTSDDDLIARACAMTEPYVQRCRPEWRVPVTPFASLHADIRSSGGFIYVFLSEWQTANPPGFDIVSGRPNVCTLFFDSVESWGAFNPVEPARCIAIVNDTSEEGLIIDRDGVTVSSGQIAHWANAGTLVAFTYNATTFQLTADTRISSYLPDAETYQGAVMYAAREYRRRNSPAGIESFGETTSFIARFDPDIDRALQTGSFARPVIS